MLACKPLVPATSCTSSSAPCAPQLHVFHSIPTHPAAPASRAPPPQCVTDDAGGVVKPYGVRVGLLNWNTDAPSQYEFRRVFVSAAGLPLETLTAHYWDGRPCSGPARPRSGGLLAQHLTRLLAAAPLLACTRGWCCIPSTAAPARRTTWRSWCWPCQSAPSRWRCPRRPARPRRGSRLSSGRARCCMWLAGAQPRWRTGRRRCGEPASPGACRDATRACCRAAAVPKCAAARLPSHLVRVPLQRPCLPAYVGAAMPRFPSCRGTSAMGGCERCAWGRSPARTSAPVRVDAHWVESLRPWLAFLQACPARLTSPRRSTRRLQVLRPTRRMRALATVEGELDQATAAAAGNCLGVAGSTGPPHFAATAGSPAVVHCRPLIWRRAGQPDMLVGVVSYGPTPKCGEANLNLGGGRERQGGW